MYKTQAKLRSVLDSSRMSLVVMAHLLSTLTAWLLALAGNDFVSLYLT